MFPQGYGITVVATLLVVALCVVVHYEGLRFLTDRVPRPQYHQRRRVLILILLLLLLHVAEVWLFGLGYYLLLSNFEIGELVGMPGVNLFDCVYYSAMVYTTIGFGDIVPKGAVRLMTGTEGIVGLVMITWSASYTFVVMLKTWKLDD